VTTPNDPNNQSSKFSDPSARGAAHGARRANPDVSRVSSLDGDAPFFVARREKRARRSFFLFF